MLSASTVDDGFFAPSTGETVDIDGHRVEVPIRYHRTDAYLAVFSADTDAVRAMLPSRRLHPVRLGRGRAAVGVMSYNYLETGVGAYGEIGIAAMCTLDRPRTPLTPLLRESRDPSFGAFVWHLPVTTRIARDAGRAIWGYPKFVADMAFEERPEVRQVTMREGGRDILRVRVRRRGRPITETNPLVTFTEHDGEMIRTVIATRAVHQLGLGRNQGHLELGDHPVADELRSLDISTDTVATKSYLAHAAILPRGASVGASDRRHIGFIGSDALSGRHTIRYDGATERVVTEGVVGDGSGLRVPVGVV